MKRILLLTGVLFTIVAGFSSCAVEGTAYPGYREPRVSAGIYYRTPAPRYYYGRPRYRSHYHYHHHYNGGYYR